MKPSHYRDKFISLQKNACDRDALFQLAKQIANSFMDHYYQDGHYDEGYIDLMCEMATFFTDRELNRAVSSAFFSVIIEELCDDYEEFRLEAYNRVMSQVISYCRRVPAGEKIDRCLNQFRLFRADDILRRAGRIHNGRVRMHAETKAIRRIYLLSRITVGADVAIVSVMIQRLSVLFPEAELILLGSLKLREIFGANPRLRIREAGYLRNGGLLERLEGWCELVDVLRQERADDGAEAVLVIDSDSRLTQLGVLPVIQEDSYLYFNSHDDSLSAGGACMAELTNAWIDRVFGRSGFCYPRLWLQPELSKKGEEITQTLRQNGCRKIIVVNFGVGGNSRKRLGLAFEKKLIGELLKRPGSVVLLDQGFGDEELAISREMIEEAKSKDYPVCQAEFIDSGIENFSQGLLAVKCGIGQIAALIEGSDQFIGYDSACQHIAAALAVPAVTVFAGSNNPHFIRRWSACGNTSCRVVHMDTPGHHDEIDLQDVIDRILEDHPQKTSKAGSRRKILDIKKASPEKTKAKIKSKQRTL